MLMIVVHAAAPDTVSDIYPEVCALTRSWNYDVTKTSVLWSSLRKSGVDMPCAAAFISCVRSILTVLSSFPLEASASPLAYYRSVALLFLGQLPEYGVDKVLGQASWAKL